MKTSVISTRKRAVQCLYRAPLTWPVRGSGIAWFNADHSSVSVPLNESMNGYLYSNKPIVSYKSWTAPSTSGPDGLKVIQFDWVDSSGTVIDTVNYAGRLLVDPLNAGGYIPVAILGVDRSFNVLPAGLKQTILDYPPTEGTWDVSCGLETGVLLMTLQGNNLPL